MIIRAATYADVAAVDDVIRAAFAASELGYNGEADLVRLLHDDGDIVCSLVAEDVDEAVVGHVLFSRMNVEADGVILRAIGLAPVSVVPQHQRSGIGARLIEAGLGSLKAAGFQIAFVVGHADYYPRFGYRAELAEPYQSRFAGPHFMAVHLDSTLVVPQRGRADYAPAFAQMD